jgi:hypothetical protein
MRSSCTTRKPSTSTSDPRPVDRGHGGILWPVEAREVLGGWLETSIEVTNLEAVVARLRQAGVHFPDGIVDGVGATHIFADDPSESQVERFQATVAAARLGHAASEAD